MSGEGTAPDRCLRNGARPGSPGTEPGPGISETALGQEVGRRSVRRWDGARPRGGTAPDQQEEGHRAKTSKGVQSETGSPDPEKEPAEGAPPARPDDRFEDRLPQPKNPS